MQRRKLFLSLLATCAVIPVLTVSAQDGPPKPSTEPVTGSWYAIAYFYKEGHPDVVVKSGFCETDQEAMSCAYNSNPPGDDFYLYSLDVFPSSSGAGQDCEGGEVISSVLDDATATNNAVERSKVTNRPWDEESKWDIVVDVETEKNGTRNRKRRKNKVDAMSWGLLKAYGDHYKEKYKKPGPNETKTIKSLHFSREIP